jgi:hypothetical protein
MTDFHKVTFLRHSPPYMPGDSVVLPAGRAKALEETGHVEIAGRSKAPKIETGRTEFDPAKSPIDEVRGFLVGHGLDIAAEAKEADLRKLAAETLASLQQ